MNFKKKSFTKFHKRSYMNILRSIQILLYLQPSKLSKNFKYKSLQKRKKKLYKLIFWTVYFETKYNIYNK